MSLSTKEEDKLEEVNLKHYKIPNQLESTQIIINEAVNTLGYTSEVLSTTSDAECSHTSESVIYLDQFKNMGYLLSVDFVINNEDTLPLFCLKHFYLHKLSYVILRPA